MIVNKDKFQQLMDRLDQLEYLIMKFGLAEKNELEEKQVTHNPHFYRYIRPIDFKTGDADSQRGVTLSIYLNYDRRLMSVSYSICNNEPGEPSFSKELGRRIADQRTAILIPLWDEPGPLKDMDITYYIIDQLKNSEDTIKRLPDRDRKLIINMFEQS